MIRILLIRHGNTDLSGRVVYGRAPGVHLSEQGRRQAQAAGLAIRNRCRLDRVISSPMERTLETARLIAEPHCLDVAVEEGFNEVDVGEWMGKTMEELQTAPEWQQYNRVRSLYSPPGGEALIDVQRRSWSALARIVRELRKGTLAVVTHGDVIRALLLLFLGAPLDHVLRLEVAPGSVSEVTLANGEPLVRTINEVFG